jgi:hypothetical protein
MKNTVFSSSCYSLHLPWWWRNRSLNAPDKGLHRNGKANDSDAGQKWPTNSLSGWRVHLEEAWGILRNKGYQNQFEGDWMGSNLIL